MSTGQDEESIGALLTRLGADARSLGEAELAYYKALAADKLKAARAGLLMAVVAVALLVAASIALVVGLVLTLTPLVGPGFATLIVVVVALGVAGLLGWNAWRNLKRILDPKQ